MNVKIVAALAAATLTIITCCVAGAVLGLGGIATVGCTMPAQPRTATAAGNPPLAPVRSWPPVGRWSSRQVANAAAIVVVGQHLHIPPRGWVIAVATAMQESALTNLGNVGPGNDHDSLGLFQQRPSQGWGTSTQLLDPFYAATAFYTHLLPVSHWPDLPLTEAAQAVQRSAFPDAYANHEPDAIALVATVTGLPPTMLARCQTVGGWIEPVHGPIVSGFRTPERPSHDGIDIAAAKGTIIHAAAAGTVTRIRCNATLDGRPYPCDIDGAPAVRGCGWYTEITHPGNLVTRYCHQLTRPPVEVGQQVAAGQPVGLVGSSGNSSGPHLHFELHTGTPATPANAIDPAAFLHSTATNAVP